MDAGHAGGDGAQHGPAAAKARGGHSFMHGLSHSMLRYAAAGPGGAPCSAARTAAGQISLVSPPQQGTLHLCCESCPVARAKQASMCEHRPHRVVYLATSAGEAGGASRPGLRRQGVGGGWGRGSKEQTRLSPQVLSRCYGLQVAACTLGPAADGCSKTLAARSRACRGWRLLTGTCWA